MTRRHIYRIERLVDGVVVETIRPKQSGSTGAQREARELARSLAPRRLNGPWPMVRAVNVSMDRVIAAYRRVGDKAVRV